MRQKVRNYLGTAAYNYAQSPAEVARLSGKARIARLASNENPWPPTPVAIEAGIRALRGVNRYPGESSAFLEDALRQRYGDYTFGTGVGMDGVIETVVRTLVEPGEKVAVATPTFSFYRLCALAQGADVVFVPRSDGFRVDPDAFVDEVSGTRLAFLCSPNNPTGNVTPVDDICTILESYSGVLFLDCAYVEFSRIDYLPLLAKYENLVIGRTFSKAYSLAGLRAGYAFLPQWLGDPYRKAATPHTLNSVSAAAAAAALQDTAHVERIVAHVRRWQERIARECPLSSLPSGANFVLVDTTPRTGDAVTARLAAEGVLVRSGSGFPGLPPHYIRVSIGEDWEMEAFLQAVHSL